MLRLALVGEDGLFAAEMGWYGVVERVVDMRVVRYAHLHYGFE